MRRTLQTTSDKLTPLGRVIKAGNLRTGRREIWGAITADDVWAMERIEDTGTPWILIHQPTRIEVGTYGTLRSCREAITMGWAWHSLRRVLASRLETERLLAERGADDADPTRYEFCIYALENSGLLR